MWKIFFMCYGLYCETGQDLGWHVDQRFQTHAECEQFGRDVMEFVGEAVFEMLMGQNEDLIGEGEFLDNSTREQVRDLGVIVVRCYRCLGAKT